MQINLRKARKLDAKIAKVISEQRLNAVAEVRIRSTLEEAQSQLAATEAKFSLELDNLLKLNQVRYDIRGQIANANQGTGINALMNEREALKQKNTILEKLLNSEEAPSQVKLKDILDANVKSLDSGGNGYSRPSVTVSVPALTVDKNKSFYEEFVANTKALEDIEDQLAQKNLGAKVTLGEESVLLLQTLNLV